MNVISFEDLYKEHYSALRNIADNIVGKDQSHDIVQEIFLKLWTTKEKLDEVTNQKAYLFKSVINASLTQLERNKRFPRLSTVHAEPVVNTSTSIEQKELEGVIANALDNLPPRCKTIFVLSRFEEMKYSEIASHLDISVNTVETQMGIALKKMRADLGPYLSQEFIALTLTAGIAVFMRFMPFMIAFTILIG